MVRRERRNSDGGHVEDREADAEHFRGRGRRRRAQRGPRARMDTCIIAVREYARRPEATQ